MAAEPRPGPLTDPNWLLHERYIGPTARSRKLDLYYALKPLMPRRLQLALRRAYAPTQAKREFPAWPFEPSLVEHRDGELLAELRASGLDRLPIVNFWPERQAATRAYSPTTSRGRPASRTSCA